MYISEPFDHSVFLLQTADWLEATAVPKIEFLLWSSSMFY